MAEKALANDKVIIDQLKIIQPFGGAESSNERSLPTRPLTQGGSREENLFNRKQLPHLQGTGDILKSIEQTGLVSKNNLGRRLRRVSLCDIDHHRNNRADSPLWPENSGLPSLPKPFTPIYSESSSDAQSDVVSIGKEECDCRVGWLVTKNRD